MHKQRSICTKKREKNNNFGAVVYKVATEKNKQQNSFNTGKIFNAQKCFFYKIVIHKLVIYSKSTVRLSFCTNSKQKKTNNYKHIQYNT